MSDVGFACEIHPPFSAPTLSFCPSMGMWDMANIYMQTYAWTAATAGDQSPGSPSFTQGQESTHLSVSPALSSFKLTWLAWCCQDMDENQAGSNIGCVSRWAGAFL